MDVKNMTMAIVALTIGVVLIAGGVTPILVSAISGSGSDEVTFTNTGGRIGELSDIVEKYDIHSVYETVDEDTDDPWETETTGTRMVRFVNDDNELKWQIWEVTAPFIDDLEYRVVQTETITQDCVLVAGEGITVAYNYEEKELRYATSYPNSYFYSYPLNDLPNEYDSFTIMYTNYDADIGMSLWLMFGGYYDVISDDGMAYDPSGDHVSKYGNTGNLYYDSDFIYGYLNVSYDTAYILISYLNDNGNIIEITDQYDEGLSVSNIIDTHSEIMGCNYMDLENGDGITMDITRTYGDSDMGVSCNIYIVPLTVKGTAQEVKNEGQAMTKIEDLMAQGYSYKVEPVSEGSTYYKWEILDSSNNVIRSEEFTEFIITPFIISDKIYGAYRDLNTYPKLHDFYLETVDDVYNVAPNPTDFVLTIGMENGITTLRATSDILDNPLEITGMTGFLTDSEGDWTYIHTEPRGTDSYPVKYSNINDVYFMNSAGIYGYQGGMSSDLVIFGGETAGYTPTTTVTVDRLEGVSDFGIYKQFNCITYDSANGDPEIQPSGILLKIEDPATDTDMTVSANMYIVPTVAYKPSEDSGGLDPALVAVISIIPVVMIAGLIVTAITMWKAQ